MCGFETKPAILNNTIRGNARGGIYENIISESLLRKEWKSGSKGNFASLYGNVYLMFIFDSVAKVKNVYEFNILPVSPLVSNGAGSP